LNGRNDDGDQDADDRNDDQQLDERKALPEMFHGNLQALLGWRQ
jgi:hypothetical protein